MGDQRSQRPQELTLRAKIPYREAHPLIAGPTPMAIRPILVIPDARLRAVTDPIAEIDDEIKALASDMLETMYDAPGIGLRSEEHTSELQSRPHLVCRLLLEKKK